MNDSCDEQLTARGELYGLLALGFYYPETKLYESWCNGEFFQQIKSAVACAAPEMSETLEDKFLDQLELNCDFKEFESLYLSAFETDLPKRSVSLYGGTYVKGGKSELLLELKSFYSNFGLAISKDYSELEDRITAELEFMQFLAMKQTQDGITQAPYIRAQCDFIDRHLNPWMPRLQHEVRKRKIAPFYIALTDLTAAYIAADREYLKGLDDRAEAQLAQH
jgi:putative dimethyl sulfoxide reductase chaperone